MTAPIRIEISFGRSSSPNFQRAVELAGQLAAVRVTGEGRAMR